MATTLQAKHRPLELLAPDTPSLVISRTEQGTKKAKGRTDVRPLVPKKKGRPVKSA